MGSFALLFLGMAIVVGGILAFRLHAFVALVLAALVVAAFTPREKVLQNEHSTFGLKIESAQPGEVSLKLKPKQKLVDGRGSLFRKAEGSSQWTELGPATLGSSEREGLRKLQTEVAAQKGDLFLHHTHLSAASSTAGSLFADRVAFGFGDTCRKIGILIAMASIIGLCLTRSGAAERIVHTLCALVGIKRAPLGFVGSGFLLGIPVFFDTVFYLMMPLGKALGRRMGGKNYLLIVLCIVAGGTMAHSLVPPTPGPLLVASELGVPLATAVLAGLVVGLFTVTAGYLFARWISSRMEVPMRSTEGEEESIPSEEEIEARKAQLPGFFVSVLPILLPVLLLAGSTVIATMMKNGSLSSESILGPAFKVLGNKNIAITLGALIGLVLVRMSKPGRDLKFAPFLGEAIASAGVIILITAAGGAFGHVLRQTDLAGATSQLLPNATSGLALLVIGFFLCTLIRTAQGSATVAMITAVGIVAPLALGTDLPYHPVYLALAIGCGSKPISWMNDSGFWVISKMSGLTESEMLRTNTLMGIVMATVGLIVCLIGAMVFPMV